MDFQCPSCRALLPAVRPGVTVICDRCGFAFAIESVGSGPTGTNFDSLNPLSGIELQAPRQPVTGPTLSEVVDAGPAADLVPGYERLELLGTGSLGEVWRVRERAKSRTRLLRLLHSAITRDDGPVRDFETEERALSLHRFGDVLLSRTRGFTRDRRYYLVYEDPGGRTLRALLDDDEVDLASTPALALRLAQGMAGPHRAGFVHRDLKPENVLALPRPGGTRLLILDFGLAAAFKYGSTRINFTDEGIVVANPYYQAPEVREDPRAHSTRSDVFALGVMFYEMATGELPRGGERSIRAHQSSVDPDFDELVELMLAPDPQKRPASAQTVMLRLEPGVDSVPPTFPPPDPPVLTTPQQTTDQARLLIEGRSSPGTRVLLSINQKELGLPVVGTGEFSQDVELSFGLNTVTAVAEHRGQRSSSAGPLSITRLPATPQLDPMPESTLDATIIVSGRVRPGIGVQFHVGPREVEVSPDSTGAFQVSVPLEEGPNVLVAFASASDVRSRSAATAQVLRVLRPVRLDLPSGIVRKAVWLARGHCSPLCEVSVMVDERTTTTVSGADGRFEVPLRLRLGSNELRLWASRGGLASPPVGPLEIRRYPGWEVVFLVVAALITSAAVAVRGRFLARMPRPVPTSGRVR